MENVVSAAARVQIVTGEGRWSSASHQEWTDEAKILAEACGSGPCSVTVTYGLPGKAAGGHLIGRAAAIAAASAALSALEMPSHPSSLTKAEAQLGEVTGLAWGMPGEGTKDGWTPWEADRHMWVYAQPNTIDETKARPKIKKAATLELALKDCRKSSICSELDLLEGLAKEEGVEVVCSGGDSGRGVAVMLPNSADNLISCQKIAFAARAALGENWTVSITKSAIAYSEETTALLLGA